jgi:hypothetical protein
LLKSAFILIKFVYENWQREMLHGCASEKPLKMSFPPISGLRHSSDIPQKAAQRADVLAAMPNGSRIDMAWVVLHKRFALIEEGNRRTSNSVSTRKLARLMSEKYFRSDKKSFPAHHNMSRVPQRSCYVFSSEINKFSFILLMGFEGFAPAAALSIESEPFHGPPRS